MAPHTPASEVIDVLKSTALSSSLELPVPSSPPSSPPSLPSSEGRLALRCVEMKIYARSVIKDTRINVTGTYATIGAQPRAESRCRYHPTLPRVHSTHRNIRGIDDRHQLRWGGKYGSLTISDSECCRSRRPRT